RDAPDRPAAGPGRETARHLSRGTTPESCRPRKRRSTDIAAAAPRRSGRSRRRTAASACGPDRSWWMSARRILLSALFLGGSAIDEGERVRRLVLGRLLGCERADRRGLVEPDP